MTVTISGTAGVTAPEVVLDNSSADGGQVVLKSSGYSNWNIDNYSGVLRAYYNATEYLKVSATGDLQFNSGYGSVVTGYGCRAWVNFNGTTSPGTIRGSGNVTSVTKNSTGNYTVNFTNSLTDTNYSAVCSAGDAGGYNMTAYVLTTSSVRLSATYETSGPTDTSIAQLAIFR